MGFSSWLCSKTQKSIPAFPYAGRLQRESEVVLVLPDDSTVTGVYDGYGHIDATDVYTAVGKHVLGTEDREEVFNSIKNFYKDSEAGFSLDKFNWEEPITKEDVVAGELPEKYLGAKMNDLHADGWRYKNNFHKVMDAVKIVRKDSYANEKYSELAVSKNCPNQGFFYDDE